MNYAFVFSAAVGLIFFAGASALTCENAKATHSGFSTKDAFFHHSTAFIVEFVLTCSNNVRELPLYGEVNGKLLPAAISEETGRYQISWTEEHEKALAGTYTVNIVDEDGYAAIRKAQRNNEDISKVKNLFSVNIDHPGPTKEFMVSTETIVLVVAVLVGYFAFSQKSNLQS